MYVWGLFANKGEIIIKIWSTASRSWKESFLTISTFECVNVQWQNVCRQFHLEKAWISTGPVTAENEERCGSALYVEDALGRKAQLCSTRNWWNIDPLCFTFIWRERRKREDMGINFIQWPHSMIPTVLYQDQLYPHRYNWAGQHWNYTKSTLATLDLHLARLVPHWATKDTHYLYMH
jgi:hypothetical protein